MADFNLGEPHRGRWLRRGLTAIRRAFGSGVSYQDQLSAQPPVRNARPPQHIPGQQEIAEIIQADYRAKHAVMVDGLNQTWNETVARVAQQTQQAAVPDPERVLDEIEAAAHSTDRAIAGLDFETPNVPLPVAEGPQAPKGRSCLRSMHMPIWFTVLQKLEGRAQYPTCKLQKRIGASIASTHNLVQTRLRGWLVRRQEMLYQKNGKALVEPKDSTRL